MNIKRITNGLYEIECNGIRWRVEDTGYKGDFGNWRWMATRQGEETGYSTSTYKNAKELVAQYSK